VAKLNWDRQPNETYDASLDVEWRRGPIDVSFEFPDGEATVDLKLNAVPDIYWAKALGKAFRDDSEEGNVKLFDAAWRAAASVYYSGGWNLGRPRMLSLYQRASGLVPYPSLYFAVYFDCCLLNVVKYDHKQRGAALPPSFPAMTTRSTPEHSVAIANSPPRWACRASTNDLGTSGGRSSKAEDDGRRRHELWLGSATGKRYVDGRAEVSAMGWRTDQAYEDARRADYHQWRASMTWAEYLAVLWRRWSPMVAGMATAFGVIGLFWLAR
jgi:hypothetical protein